MELTPTDVSQLWDLTTAGGVVAVLNVIMWWVNRQFSRFRHWDFASSFVAPGLGAALFVYLPIAALESSAIFVRIVLGAGAGCISMGVHAGQKKLVKTIQQQGSPQP
jgi:hypothetical protein